GAGVVAAGTAGRVDSTGEGWLVTGGVFEHPTSSTMNTTYANVFIIPFGLNGMLLNSTGSLWIK
ncbi:MAG TPA: hypothetical protein VN364_07910, partial [Bellilinea sp.]|nr:hypothetical protein [Bellilinea sp.]